ncbi:hypothetical protein QE152_g5111 [Popillia japonica]|uniref:Uncharacterized protein n=1 Tax=Popillia japonica TaxID=7064 RepID=A0AAW1MQZ3_POPJA
MLMEFPGYNSMIRRFDKIVTVEENDQDEDFEYNFFNANCNLHCYNNFHQAGYSVAYHDIETQEEVFVDGLLNA